MNRKSFVAVIMGSDSDLGTMSNTLDVLEKLGIAYEVKIASAHRTPDFTQAYVKEADRRGCAVFIAAAGLANHLSGTIAALTVKPVIGVPMATGPLQGQDALFSTVQMPGGIPVACVAIGSPGAKNAAYLAAEILALSDQEVARRLVADREAIAAEVVAKDAALGKKLEN
ncbi:MAG: 5-(carboxyamino)imidazole ribonucleotide mutase [Acidiferrobacterales bacterium]